MTKEQMGARLRMAFERRNVLILAHRGVSGANIVDNTIESYEAAIRHGADMVEVDVCASLDGDLFVFHDGMEPLMLDTGKRLTEMTTAQVRAQRYINRNDIRIGHAVNTLDEVLEHLKGRCLINLDRCWVCWDKVFPAVKRHKMADQILFKSPPEKAYIDLIAAQEEPYMYMPIIWYPEELDYVKASGANLAAVEFIGYREDAEIMQPKFIVPLRGEGIACLISALTLGNPVYDVQALHEQWTKAGSRMAQALLDGNILLAGGHDDDTSVLGNPDLGWGWLADRGFNVLQTDWTLDLSLYLKKAGYNK